MGKGSKISEETRKRKTSVDTVTIKIPVAKTEILEANGTKYVALELVLKRSCNEPYPVRNRFLTYVARGKYNTSSMFGIRVIELKNPMRVPTTVVLEFVLS